MPDPADPFANSVRMPMPESMELTLGSLRAYGAQPLLLGAG